MQRSDKNGLQKPYEKGGFEEVKTGPDREGGLPPLSVFLILSRAAHVVEHPVPHDEWGRDHNISEQPGAQEERRDDDLVWKYAHQSVGGGGRYIAISDRHLLDSISTICCQIHRTLIK